VCEGLAFGGAEPGGEQAEDGVEVGEGGAACAVEADVIVEVVEEFLVEGRVEGGPAETVVDPVSQSARRL
jgi:hypothetical protein